MNLPRAVYHGLHRAFLRFKRTIQARSALFIYMRYRLSADKTGFLRALPFESLHRLAEFRSKAVKEEISSFLRDNPDHNSKLQEWQFLRADAEGLFDPSQEVFQKLLATVKADKAIRTFIDIGCNSGEVTHQMTELGIEATGIDFPKVVATIPWPIKAIGMDLNKEFPTGSYDIVFCKGTFEHFSDPDGFLANCAGISHPGTYLFISCPYSARHYEDNAFHLRILSREQLSALLKTHGFETKDVFADREENFAIARKI
ncbi:MAG: class I SAM-dependent methyltransferase [Elusimicrobiota bacterium]